MGFEDDRWDPKERAERDREIDAYVRRQKIARGEIVEEFPVCSDCGVRHYPGWDCGK